MPQFLSYTSYLLFTTEKINSEMGIIGLSELSNRTSFADFVYQKHSTTHCSPLSKNLTRPHRKHTPCLTVVFILPNRIQTPIISWPLQPLLSWTAILTLSLNFFMNSKKVFSCVRTTPCSRPRCPARNHANIWILLHRSLAPNSVLSVTISKTRSTFPAVALIIHYSQVGPATTS